MLNQTRKLYRLNDQQHRRKFSNTSGIYAFIYNNEVIYVGQSVNLNKRISQHRLKSYFKEIENRYFIKNERNCQKTYELHKLIQEHINEIYFIILEQFVDLDKYERYYIEYFKPRFNYIGIDKPYIYK